MIAEDILNILERTYMRHPGNILFLREFPLRSGVQKGRGRTQKIDALMIGVAAGYGHHRTAYEVKIDRKDYFREIAAPEKRRPAIDVSDQFYFATPEGLIAENEIPPECGLIEVADHGPCIIKNAPRRKAKDLDWPTTIDIARRAFQLGQQDWAKREPLDAWCEVSKLVDVTSEFEIDLDEQLETLRLLAQRMRQHGRLSEAKHVEISAKKLRQRAATYVDEQS